MYTIDGEKTRILQTQDAWSSVRSTRAGRVAWFDNEGNPGIDWDAYCSSKWRRAHINAWADSLWSRLLLEQRADTLIEAVAERPAWWQNLLRLYIVQRAPLSWSTDPDPRVRIAAGVKDLRGVDLRGALLRDVDLRGVDLSQADLRGAILSRADLSRADLRGANLRGANLRGANLTDADLRDTDLFDADLYEIQAIGAYFERSNLRSASLWYANLERTSFRFADLRDADLSGAYVLSTKFFGAYMYGCRPSRDCLLKDAIHARPGRSHPPRCADE